MLPLISSRQNIEYFPKLLESIFYFPAVISVRCQLADFLEHQNGNKAFAAVNETERDGGRVKWNR